MLLGDAEILRWFLLPSEADVFLRKETHDGYPKVPPFTPLRRCYHGKMKVSGEDTEHRKEENRKCEQKYSIGCKVEVEICEQNEIKEKLEIDKSIETEDNDICESEKNKDSHETPLENKLVKTFSTENCSGIKFHNPSRHMFNLVVKVC